MVGIYIMNKQKIFEKIKLFEKDIEIFIIYIIGIIILLLVFAIFIMIGYGLINIIF